MVIQVNLGDGCSQAIPDPRGDDSLEWELRYALFGRAALCAAEVIAGFDCLLSDAISAKEAVRRLRFLRKARKAAIKGVTHGD